MPRTRYLLAGRLGWWGVVLTAWDLWRRIPKQHRKHIYRQVRKHAPTVARAAAREAQRARAAARSHRDGA